MNFNQSLASNIFHVSIYGCALLWCRYIYTRLVLVPPFAKTYFFFAALLSPSFSLSLSLSFLLCLPLLLFIVSRILHVPLRPRTFRVFLSAFVNSMSRRLFALVFVYFSDKTKRAVYIQILTWALNAQINSKRNEGVLFDGFIFPR